VIRSLFFSFLFLGAISAQAQVIPKFDVKTFLDQFSRQMTVGLAKKIQELQQTFIVRSKGNSSINPNETIAFFANGQDVCGQKNFVGQVAMIGFNSVRKKDSLSQALYYYGCDDGVIQFIELLQTRGQNLQTLTDTEFISAQRRFWLQPGETYRKYSLLDTDKVEILSFTTSVIKPAGWQTVMTVMGQQVATFITRPTPTGDVIDISKNPVNISASFAKGPINLNDSSEINFHIGYFQNAQIYMDQLTREEISYPALNTSLDGIFTQLYLSAAQQLFTLFIKDGFPQSALAPNNSLLKNQLLTLQGQVYSNPTSKDTYQKVLDFITISLKAIEDGKIIDSRSK
jgi:hypothetical protein